MPDGILTPTETTSPELAADTADSRLLRHVRRNLVLWSGGTTLLILVALAAALYFAAASSLASAGVDQLEQRMSQAKGERPDPDDRSPYGFVFGGGATYAMILDPVGNVVLGPREQRPPPGLPYEPGVQAAAGTGKDITTANVGISNPVPVRILTETVEVPQRGTYTIQIVQDRTTEQQTLQVILFVLVVGGLLVLIVSFGFGTIYARRALIPIRESLANQRVALRRQREFAADASHELRTPLTVIRSSVEYLERHRDEPGAAAAAVPRGRRKVPRGARGRAGRGRRLGARGHRRRGPPHDGDRQGPAAA